MRSVSLSGVVCRTGSLRRVPLVRQIVKRTIRRAAAMRSTPTASNTGRPSPTTSNTFPIFPSSFVAADVSD